MATIVSFNAYVISLKKDDLRRKSIAEELSKHNIRFKFFDAIDGKSLFSPIPEYAIDIRRLWYGYELTLGEIGCFLSHRALWKTCVELDTPLLIFEDDVEIKVNIQEILCAISKIEEDFDFLRLSGVRTKKNIRLKIQSFPEFKVVEELRDPSGTGAYIITPRGASKLLKSSSSFFVPVDNFISQRFSNNLKSLAIFPYPVQLKNFETTITDRASSEKTPGIRLRRLFFRAVVDVRQSVWIVLRIARWVFLFPHRKGV